MRLVNTLVRALLLVLIIGNSLSVFAEEVNSDPVESDASVQPSVSQGVNELRFEGIDDPLLSNVRKHVTLYTRLQSSEPLRRGEVRRLRRQVAQQIQDALRPYGYYQATATVISENSGKQLVYSIELNQPVILKSLDISIEGSAEHQAEFAEWRKDYPLSEGDILNQAIYEQRKKSLLTQALRKGYFDAEIAQSAIVIDESRETAKINMRFVPGQRYTISEVDIEWQQGESERASKKLINDDLLRSYLTVQSGDIFNGDELVKSQRNLLGTPYFARVSVQAGETDPNLATLPIKVLLTPRKRHSYSAEAGVGTDTGVRGGVGYENRRVNSRGHNLSARLGGSEIKSSAIINYQVPRKRSPVDNYNFFASLTEETGDTRRFENMQLGVERLRKWQDSLLKFGLTASQETFSRRTEQGFEQETTTDLLLPTVRWERTKADDLYFPSRGWSASATFRAASEDAGSDISLAQVILDTKRLYSVGDGRVRLRFTLAGSLIDEAIELPESLGFLAGGDDSVRGYKYESIGVQRNGETTVAKNLVTASIEYEHPIKNGISLATFVDAGDAFDGNADYKRGAGVGLRWRLPFGALRLDAASALDLEGKPIRLHLSFGTDL